MIPGNPNTEAVPQSEPEETSIVQTAEPSWAVRRIVDMKFDASKGRIFYQVRWEDTWEPLELLQDCHALIADHHARKLNSGM